MKPIGYFYTEFRKQGKKIPLMFYKNWACSISTTFKAVCIWFESNTYQTPTPPSSVITAWKLELGLFAGKSSFDRSGGCDRINLFQSNNKYRRARVPPPRGPGLATLVTLWTRFIYNVYARSELYGIWTIIVNNGMKLWTHRTDRYQTINHNFVDNLCF